MPKIRNSNHFPLRFAGAPAETIETVPEPEYVAALPGQIPLIRPRLLVGAGDGVKIGSPLFEDKSDPAVRFLSPGGGRVLEIRYGERRAIRKIVIQRDADEPAAVFDPMDDRRLARTERGELVETLALRGLWPLVRDLTFRGIAARNDRPAAIWVALDCADPFHPVPDVYLAGRAEYFTFGLRILRKLAGSVRVIENAAQPVTDSHLRELITHRVSGPYPAGDPGVVHYRAKRSADENRAWFITGQDLLLLAEGLLTGTYPTSRIVAVSGGDSATCRHVRTRLGAPVRSLVPPLKNPEACRWVAGGLFSGHTVSPDGFLGLYETALALIPEAITPELFGFIRPGWDKPSISRTFLSTFRKGPLSTDAGMHGEERACINCGACMRICPVDILPQFTYKCLYADAIEEALRHGLLDCVECGLCSYVCPSKVELAGAFRAARQKLHKERSDR